MIFLPELKTTRKEPCHSVPVIIVLCTQSFASELDNEFF